jgi:hypothetical protein
MKLFAIGLGVLVTAVAGSCVYFVASRSQREGEALEFLAGRLEAQERNSARVLSMLADLRAAQAKRDATPTADERVPAPSASSSRPKADAVTGEESPETEQALEAADRADEVLEAAVARGNWTSGDERALVETMANMSPNDRGDVLVRRSLAINEGKLRLDPTAFMH